MAKQKTSLTLSEDAKKMLKKIADSRGLSGASTVETLIREAYQQLPLAG